MPRIVYRVSDGELGGAEIIWFYNEWCRRVPGAWRESIGCKRCGPADALFKRHPEIRERLERDLIALFCKWDGIYWYVRYYPDRGVVCLTPWPKKLYRGLF